MKRIISSVAIGLLSLSLLLVQPAPAQLTRGILSGTLQDGSGGVIGGAQVTVVNSATGLTRETTTNSLGIYRFAAVEPGVYRLEFASRGFDTVKLERLEVNANQEVVTNRVLSVGKAVTVLVVTSVADTAELTKASPTIGLTLPGSFVESVPLTAGTRDVTRLALLNPMVSRGPGGSEFSAAGQRARNNNFTIDGVDNNDLTTTTVTSRVIPEAVAEFQTQTAPYSAEFGRNTGAQVSVITRGGSNVFHGSVWDYHRANWMEPLSLLNKRAGLTATPRYVENQAGGSFGGPVIRNRTFFFGLVETDRRREAPDARNADPISIPTPAGYAALAGVPLGSGQTASNRQAILDSISFLPGIQGRISQFQNPTSVNVNGVPIQIGTALIPLATPHDYWYAHERIDHQLTSRDNVSYRYQLDRQNRSNADSNRGFGSMFSASEQTFNQNHALTETHAFSAGLINEFRFGYARQNYGYAETDSRSTVNVGSLFTIGGSNIFPQSRLANTFQWQDVATWMHGRHSVKAGVDVRRNRLFNRSGFDAKGTWSFDNLSDFLNNNASSYRQAVNESSFDARQTNQNYFFQDDIRIRKDLTVNLGIRYEYSGVPLGFFGATDPRVLAAGVPGPVRPDRNNWAPRFGVAYAPGGKTVFRGGYGIAYDVLFYNILVVNASNYPRVVTAEIDAPNTFQMFPGKLPVQATAPAFDPLAKFINSPTDLQNPTTHFYSFSVQRQLSKDMTLEAGYAGSRSYHQLRQGQSNPGLLTADQAAKVIASGSSSSIPGVQARRAVPAWGSRVSMESTGLANYNALYVRFDKKISDRLLLGANYTWSATFSDSDELLSIPDLLNSTPHVPQNYYNYKNDYSRSLFDRPQRMAVYYSYRLPWFTTGVAGRSVLGRVFQGWQMAGLSEWQSGQPFTVRTGVDSGGSGTAVPFRPNYNPGGIFAPDPVDGSLRTFVTPIDGSGIFVTPLTKAGAPLANSMSGGGTLGRNTFRGPGFANSNLSLTKTVALSERWKLQLRSDWINLWNHRNFGNPVATANNPSAFGTNVTDPGGRTMLLSAKIRF